MKKALNSSETSVLKTATRRNVPEDAILHSHRRENLKSYIPNLVISHFLLNWCPIRSFWFMKTEEQHRESVCSFTGSEVLAYGNSKSSRGGRCVQHVCRHTPHTSDTPPLNLCYDKSVLAHTRCCECSEGVVMEMNSKDYVSSMRWRHNLCCIQQPLLKRNRKSFAADQFTQCDRIFCEFRSARNYQLNFICLLKIQEKNHCYWRLIIRHNNLKYEECRLLGYYAVWL
jgi:hypothetical protein